MSVRASSCIVSQNPNNRNESSTLFDLMKWPNSQDTKTRKVPATTIRIRVPSAPSRLEIRDARG